MIHVETVLNRLTDADWGWWPVLSLRPAKDQDIDNLILVKLSLVFGPSAGFLAAFLVGVLLGIPSWRIFVVAIIATTILFFVIFKFTFAVCWNRRARQLRGIK